MIAWNFSANTHTINRTNKPTLAHCTQQKSEKKNERTNFYRIVNVNKSNIRNSWEVYSSCYEHTPSAKMSKRVKCQHKKVYRNHAHYAAVYVSVRVWAWNAQERAPAIAFTFFSAVLTSMCHRHISYNFFWHAFTFWYCSLNPYDANDFFPPPIYLSSKRISTRAARDSMREQFFLLSLATTTQNVFFFLSSHIFRMKYDSKTLSIDLLAFGLVFVFLSAIRP